MMKRMLFSAAVLLLAGWVITLNSCYYDVEQDLYPVQSCDTSNVTYSLTIKPMLESSCFSCHSAAQNQGSVNLEGYDNVIPYITSGSLLGDIRHDSGFNPMPKGGSQWSSCDIKKLETWINAGALNN